MGTSNSKPFEPFERRCPIKKPFKILILVLVILVFGGVAHAIPITGEVVMLGFGSSNIDTLTATEIPPPLSATVIGPTGDFATYLSSGDAVFFNGFVFDPAPTPVADPLWEVKGFTFVLESIIVSFRDANNLVLDGIGTLSGNGFDETAGRWSMSIDDYSQSFGFSSGTAAPVPEPATLFLIGTGLVGIAGVSRKKLKK